MLVKGLTYGTQVDIHEVVQEDPIIAAIHANAEVFSPKVEFAFSYLQVSVASCRWMYPVDLYFGVPC